MTTTKSKRRAIGFVAALALAGTASAQDVRVVRAGRLILDPAVPAVENGVVVLEGATILASGPAVEVEVPEGALTIDLTDYTVLPGLIDAHTHLSVAPYWSTSQPSPALGALRASQGLQRALEAGVTTLRVTGSLYFTDVALRDAVREGILPGPRVVPAAHALTAPGGHGDPFALSYTLTPEGFYTPLYGFVTSPAEAEKAVLLQAKYGAEVIKVSASGGIGSPLDHPSQMQFSEASLEAIVDTAHRLGLRVTAHAESLDSVHASLRAGVDSIDHGSELDDDAVRLMKRDEVYLVPTLHVVGLERNPARTSAFVLQKAHEIHDVHMASFARALAGGAPIAAGSDSPYTGQFTVVDEIRALVAHEMAPGAALTAATSGNARALGLQDEIGRLSPGLAGDLIAVRGDPVEDVDALDDIVMVMRHGRVVVSRLTSVALDVP